MTRDLPPVAFDSTRRCFLKQMGAAALIAAGVNEVRAADAAAKPGSKIRLGLVTYMWAAGWDLPTIIRHLEAS